MNYMRDMAYVEATWQLNEMRRIIEPMSFEDFTVENLLSQVRKVSDSFEYKLGEFLRPIRIAVTGSHISPPLMDCMIILGKELVLKRIQRAIDLLVENTSDWVTKPYF